MMMSSETTYAQFEALEERVAHCYFLLHERFINNPQLATFFAEAAMDELQHSSLLKFCRERGIMSSLQIDPAAAEKVRKLVDSVSAIAADPRVTVNEAFNVSLMIESSEMDDVFDKLTQPLNRDHPFLYEAIQSSLRLHHLKFDEAAKRFLGDHARIEDLQQLGTAKS
jgi:hypothetical protein